MPILHLYHMSVRGVHLVTKMYSPTQVRPVALIIAHCPVGRAKRRKDQTLQVNIVTAQVAHHAMMIKHYTKQSK